jgi:hypothetical protein
MITKKEILALVKSYVEDPSSQEAFSQSFAELFYDIEKTGDESAVELAYAIEGALASVTAGLCSEAELLSGMQALLPSISVVIKPSESCVPESGKTQCVLLNVFTAWSEELAAMGVEMGTVSLVHAGIAPSAGFLLGSAHLSSPQTNTIQAPIQQLLEAR